MSKQQNVIQVKNERQGAESLLDVQCTCFLTFFVACFILEIQSLLLPTFQEYYHHAVMQFDFDRRRKSNIFLKPPKPL